MALSGYVRPIAYCEIDPYCQGVLLSRIHTGELPLARIWDDIKTFPTDGFKDNSVDIVYGGFPCQDISIAGKGKGLEGERSGLFFEIVRLAKEIKPKFIFLENTKGILSNGGLQVIEEITKIGYDCRWCVIPATEFVDQKRERWFLLAHINSERRIKRANKDIRSEIKVQHTTKPSNYKLQSMECWGAYAGSVRKDYGISYRMERVKSLGNSVCPEQTKKAFEMLMGTINLD